MEQDAQHRLIMSNAYRIFVAEFEKHLSTARSILSGERPSADDLKRLSTSFHTVKGGAGFFALAEIAELAGSLEKHFARISSLAVAQREDANRKIAELEELFRLIPKPETDKSGGGSPHA